jgi:hypothetical protein
VKRSKRALRERLELALARENYLALTLPDIEWRQVKASRAWAAWQRVNHGWMVGDDGQPDSAYLIALEQFVEALRRASEPQYRQIRTLFARKYPSGEEPFKRLVKAGANPVWIVEDCLRLVLHRLPGNRGPAENPKLRKRVITRLMQLSRQFATLANDYSTLRSDIREVGFSGVREEPATFLREQGRTLNQLARWMTVRRPSALTRRLLHLAEHLKLTTGAYHDREVCRLLDAVHPRPDDVIWSRGVLEQLRVRQKQGPKERQMSNDITEMVNDEIERRRAAAHSPASS